MATQHHPAYRARIVTDPDVLVGKPVVKGTRIPFELILAHLAKEPSLDDLFAAFPRLTLDDVKAVLAHARALSAGGAVAPAPRPRERAGSPGR